MDGCDIDITSTFSCSIRDLVSHRNSNFIILHIMNIIPRPRGALLISIDRAPTAEPRPQETHCPKSATEGL